MSIRKLINIVRITDDSKSVLYNNKAILLPDIWQPHEIAKIKAAVLVLKARSVSGLQEQESRHLEAFAQELLDKPVIQFEQKIADNGASFK